MPEIAPAGRKGTDSLWAKTGSIQNPFQPDHAGSQHLSNIVHFLSHKEERRAFYEERGGFEAYARSMRTINLYDVPLSVTKGAYDVSAMVKPLHRQGGDLFIVYHPGHDKIGIVLIDIVDKGKSAHDYMQKVYPLMQRDLFTSPAEIIGALNRRIISLKDPYLVVSAVAGMLDTGTGAFTFCAAGMPGMMAFDSNGTQCQVVTDMEGNIIDDTSYIGPPLGMFSSARYAQYDAWIPHGGTGVLYTDGATDNLHRGMDGLFYEFGEDGVRHAVRDGASMSSKKLCEHIIHKSRSGMVVDDTSVAVIKHNPVLLHPEPAHFPVERPLAQ